MTATDLDVSLVIEEETDVLGPGSVCLSGRKLNIMAGNLPDEPVHLKLDPKGNQVAFRAGRFSSKLAGFESDEFPEIANITGAAIKIPAVRFLEGLKRTIFAVSENTSRFSTAGVLVTVKNGHLTIVSTDGHRLCYFRSAFTDISDYSHPMSDLVITNVFGCERGSGGLEFGRLVLEDSVPANAESFFVAECHRRLRREGFCGVVSFSDDVPRRTVNGDVVHIGRLGYVHQALGAAFLNRGTPSKLYLLPDGTVIFNRALSKIRADESAWEYSGGILRSFGASVSPADFEERREWLSFWLDRLTRRLHHPGNLRRAWLFLSKVRLRSFPYPKIRFTDVQRCLDFS